LGQHPWNLGLRFVLEAAALFAAGYWGWAQDIGPLRAPVALALPLVLISLWATIRAPNEPPVMSPAPVEVPGSLRLMLEWAIFGFAAWCLLRVEIDWAAWTLTAATAVHYALSYDRVWWLLTH
jgi:hypothetical protein